MDLEVPEPQSDSLLALTLSALLLTITSVRMLNCCLGSQLKSFLRYFPFKKYYNSLFIVYETIYLIFRVLMYVILH